MYTIDSTLNGNHIRSTTKNKYEEAKRNIESAIEKAIKQGQYDIVTDLIRKTPALKDYLLESQLKVSEVRGSSPLLHRVSLTRS